MPSSVIRSYHYDSARRELSVVFQSRRRYTYSEVPAETYAAMKAAFSKGEFFNRHIRDKFTFRRDDDGPPPTPRSSEGTPPPRRDRLPIRQSRHSHRGESG
ncbi:MAG TPA: KTSC domain-containing protein [Reyranella sp.]|nr:KTSC domain-containing protein [Reyranella sp.]